MMKNSRLLPAATLLIAFASFTLAQEGERLLHDETLPLLAAPDFTEPLDENFRSIRGKWTPTNGILSALDIPEEKHIPVLHHTIGLSDAIIEVEFLLVGPGTFIVGCDADKHVGRVIINARGFSIAEDSVKPSHTIATLPFAAKPGKWHRLRVEWKGDRMAANLDGQELHAQHAFLATPKSRSWLAAGKSVHIRNLKISGVKTKP